MKRREPMKMQKAKLLTLSADVNENEHIHGIANSLTETRTGVTITEKAVKPIIGKKVPLLLSHEWDSLPIGSATMTQVGENGLEYEGEIFESAPNRDQILEGIRNGVLGVSVGLGVTERTDNNEVTGMDLFELSITPIPADSNATVTQALQFDDMEDANTMANEPEKTEQPTKTPDENNNGATLDDVVSALGDILKAVQALGKSKDETSDEPEKPAGEPKEENETQALTYSDLDKIAHRVVKLKGTNKKAERELLSLLKDMGANK